MKAQEQSKYAKDVVALYEGIKFARNKITEVTVLAISDEDRVHVGWVPDACWNSEHDLNDYRCFDKNDLASIVAYGDRLILRYHSNRLK